MTVTLFENTPVDQDRFTVYDVMWSRSVLVDAVIRAALTTQTESFIDMIVDGLEDRSRSGIQDTLEGVVQSTEEFLQELVHDLNSRISARLKDVKYTATVTALKYDLSGLLEDVDVAVTVNFEKP
jgi:hypothetical protein